MALNLYRRHFRGEGKCAGGHVPDSRSYEHDERRRDWKKCYCPIYADGTLGGKFQRKNTKRLTWDEARSVIAPWEAANSWTGEALVVPSPVQISSAPETSTRPAITIERAVAAFLAEHEEQSALNTQKKYRLLLNKLKSYSSEKGYTLPDQWLPMDVREFRTAWGVSPQTAAKNMSTMKSFFEFCLANEWITRNPARLVKNPRGRAGGDGRSEQKSPFSDDELKLMFEACETRYGKQEIRWSRSIHHKEAKGEYARYNYKWTGKDLADFISVSIYTGLRISDVTTFSIDRMLETGEIHVRTTKNGRKVFTWVPEWLQERIRDRAERVGPTIFGTHTSKDMNVITDVWRRKLKSLWRLCGPWPEKPTPHRFRHTFARILLQRPGVSVRDVAELLGDTEDMVRKHYAAWVPERQERLTAVLREAFSEKPRPKLVEIPKVGVVA